LSIRRANESSEDANQRFLEANRAIDFAKRRLVNANYISHGNLIRHDHAEDRLECARGRLSIAHEGSKNASLGPRCAIVDPEHAKRSSRNATSSVERAKSWHEYTGQGVEYAKSNSKHAMGGSRFHDATDNANDEEDTDAIVAR
jgi:hypothetical protein